MGDRLPRVNLLLGAEPIALELRQQTGNIFFHAQIFTGLMYIAAALCMWFLRAWKIGEIERLAVAKGKPPAEVSAVAIETVDVTSHVVNQPSSSVLRRLFAWKKV